MNLGQLEELTRSILKRYGRTAAPAEIRRRLNQAQSECSTELDSPTKAVLVQAQGRSIPLPSDAKPAGVKSVRSSDTVATLEIMSVEDASRLSPTWHLKDALPSHVAVYDPSILDADEGLAPAGSILLSGLPSELGFSSTQFLISYTVEPQPMKAPRDVPFNGAMSEYHHILAHYAAYLITGEMQEYGHYQQVLKRASADYTDNEIMPESAFFDAHMNRGKPR